MQTLRNPVRMAAAAAVALSVAWIVPSVRAQETNATVEEQQVVLIEEDQTSIEIIERFAKDLELQNRIVRVDGFDAGVVDVKALTPTRLRVEAKQQGVTTIVLIDENNNSYFVEVFVKGDARHLQAIIDSKFPDSSVEALKVRESVVLRGWVTQPEHITQIVSIAEQFYPQVLNQMNVGGVQQVLLKVKIMEVQRSKIRQMGFNFLYLNRNGFLSSTPGQLTQLGKVNLAPNGGTSVELVERTLSAATLAFGYVDDSNIFQGFFEALKEEGLLKILADPELVTTNGRPATLLSGGEFPILVPQSLGTVTIEWREFGVRLEAVPIILGEGRVRLELQPEVSERDFSNAVQLNGTTVPGLTTRRVNTQVEMKFGQSLMIAGLIASRQTASTAKIPILGELPWIGAAFRRVQYDESETELVVMVTPELVAPLEPGQVPPGGPGLFTTSPVDRELYIDGMMEVPNYGAACYDEPIAPPGAILPPGIPAPPGGVLVEPPSIQVLPNAPVPAPGAAGVELVPPAPDEAAGHALPKPLSDRTPMSGPNRATSVRRSGKPDFNFAAASGPAAPSRAEEPASTRSSWRKTRPGLIGPKPASVEFPSIPAP